MPEEVRQVILEVIESSLEAQLTAVRRLRRREGAPRGTPAAPRRSHVSMVCDILQAAGQPLHVSEIIARAQQRFGVRLDRESLVSALTKRVARADRFCRPAPNTFGLRPGTTPPEA